MSRGGLISAPKAPAAWGTLPPRIKVLSIAAGERTGEWLAEAFAIDSASKIVLVEAIGVTPGLARLREEVFDALLVCHEPGLLDALELVEGLRAGGCEEPVIILGHQRDEQFASLAFEVGADGYCPIGATTTRTLIWTFARAIERHQLIRENRRLVQADRGRLQAESVEAERLLAGQAALVADDAAAQPPADAFLNEKLVAHYREVLRTYVIMGSGNLAGEMSLLADLLASTGFTARQTIRLHVDVLGELIRGLGSRSARHVMNRANLLGLEVMMHLADDYRQRQFQQTHPARQLTLPGLDQ